MNRSNRRQFLAGGLAAGATYATLSRSTLARDANSEINLGFISCGGQANGLMGVFDGIDGVHIAGLCDPDKNRLNRASQRFPKAKTWTDLRDLIADKNIDAVVIATCNHWHCLAAIWAMEAGKDVYVEKPLSHSQWEGRQTVAAARKCDRICQVGTQQRSDPMQAEIKKFLHEEKALGAIQSARVNRYGVRGPIGKRDTPLPIDSNTKYDLWLGPAQDEPIYRDKLQYDWHWDWNTGSGEMGNWGVHVLDDLRNNVFLDKVTLPRRIFGGGGRVVWNDAGNTPNVHFVYFDTGSIPVVIGLSNLTAGAGAEQGGSAPHPGPGSGYIAYCEGGHFEGQRGRAKAFDVDGKLIREFHGNSGNGHHQRNFIAAVRSHDVSLLNTDVEVGHYTAGWCNLANIAFRTGQTFTHDDAKQIDETIWTGLLEEMQAHLTAHNIDIASADLKLSPMLQVDVAAEKFVGAHADVANRFLKRKYREGFVVPKLT